MTSQPAFAPRISILQPSRPLPSFAANDIERQAYDAYINNASAFGDPFDGNTLWRDLVLQVGDTEPYIRQAIFALGSLTRHDTPIYNGACNCQHCRVALTCYNKAIKGIARDAGDSKNADLALLACLLFIGIEIMQGKIEVATALIQKGHSLLFSVRQAAEDSSGTISPLLETLTYTFERFRLLSGLLVQPLESQSDKRSQMAITMLSQPGVLSFALLRNLLFIVGGDTHQLIRRAIEAKRKMFFQVDVTALYARQACLQAALQNWADHFATACSANANSPCPEVEYMAAALRTYYLIVSIWLSSVLEMDRSRFAIYNDQFREIVDGIDSMLPHRPHAHQQRSQVSFEMGYVPPLYFVIAQCRDLGLRRRALELLRKAPRREATWERAAVVGECKRRLELEEEEANKIYNDDGTWRYIRLLDNVTSEVQSVSLETRLMTIKLNYCWFDAQGVPHSMSEKIVEKLDDESEGSTPSSASSLTPDREVNPMPLLWIPEDAQSY